ncbi:MAG TPA: DapH/DapD/GlmU-related protein [Candidatus Dormibacteraeota bacterium]|nr:DapH/DapD/GlmU-related protein [Candidatus Dormibacteraeota bacterium]
MEPTVHPNVRLGEGVVLQPGVIVGLPPRGHEPGELETVIGAGCVLRAYTVIYAGTVLGADCSTGHGAMIREDNILGDGCSVGTHAVLEPGNRIGNRCRIHSHCFMEQVTLGDRVFLGPGVVFTDDPHPMCPRYLECVRGATIEDDVSVGGGVVVLPGVRIGARSLIGAGSVVTRNVEPDVVAAGNPARRRRAVSELTCFTGFYERPYVWREATSDAGQ